MNQHEIKTYLDSMSRVMARYPVKVSSYFLSLIEKTGDPIWLQCMPSEQELENPHGLTDDGLGEQEQSPCARLIHRYEDRVLIRLTNRCFSYCRFCFRKRFWKDGTEETEITEDEFSQILDYLRLHPEVKDVLFSGGDPLTLSDDRLISFLEQIFAIPSVDTVRLCTRAPAFQPSRITPSLANRLARFSGLWCVLHFNHPRELTSEALDACRCLKQAGLPLLNQTVLLKGVNDDEKTLIFLFRMLVKSGIKPHYLFSADPICGTGHFAVPVSRGLQMMESLRKKLSSIATPVYALDLPEGGGKVPLQPDYSGAEQGTYRSIDDRMIHHPLANVQDS